MGNERKLLREKSKCKLSLSKEENDQKNKQQTSSQEQIYKQQTSSKEQDPKSISTMSVTNVIRPDILPPLQTTCSLTSQTLPQNSVQDYERYPPCSMSNDPTASSYALSFRSS